MFSIQNLFLAAINLNPAAITPLMLKADMHIHTGNDYRDYINYSPKDLIDRAAELDFDVLSITHHRRVYHTDSLASYAKGKGILLIPGAEIVVEGKDVLVYGRDAWELTERIKGIKTLDDLADIELVIAPHPFYPTAKCLGKKVYEHCDVFDAIEHSYFYTKRLNPNRKAIEASNKLGLPLIGNSDCHDLDYFNTTYSLIDAEKRIDSVFSAIKQGGIQVVSTPLSTLELLAVTGNIAISNLKKMARKAAKTRR